jgi:dihydrofolate reductase
MLIRTHIGVSLDGFVATADGWPVLDAMPGFTAGESYGTREFIEQCPTVVVGRTTFDFGHGYWAEHGVWAWQGRRVYVLTSRPLPSRVPDDVIASEGGPAGLLAQLRAARLPGDVDLLGGPSTLRAFHQLGAIDRLEVILLPLVIVEGVPLFPLGPAPQTLQLQEHRTFPDGAVKLIYTLHDDSR